MRTELIRTVRQYGHGTRAPATAGNNEENLFDAGWHFPVPAAELAAQMRDLNQRFETGDLDPARSFWLDRPEDTADDDTDADDGSWGVHECICGQDPCECPDDDTDDGSWEDIADDDTDADPENACICGRDPCECPDFDVSNVSDAEAREMLRRVRMPDGRWVYAACVSRGGDPRSLGSN